MTNEIQLYDLDKDILIKRPHTAREYKEAIEKLEAELEESHKKYFELSSRLNKYRIKYLEKFREYFTLDCITLSRHIDLIQCSDQDCSFKGNCKPRIQLLEKLNLKNGD